MKKKTLIAFAMLMASFIAQTANACTGITLTTTDGTPVVARTIEWAVETLNSRYVIVPRGYSQRSFVPGGTKDGLLFTAKHGYVGMAVEQDELVTEGLNEQGLVAGLFYFPGYGQYQDYDPSLKNISISDLQLVPWILGSFATVDEFIAGMNDVRVISFDPRASTAHWRVADRTGRQVVLEIIGGKLHFYENKLGVLTNSPSLDWHWTNLNNYINLAPGSVPTKNFGSQSLRPFGSGSGLLGLPGDVTPPSRFVRAAFYQTTAPHAATTEDAIRQCFQILNNFDIPIGIQYTDGTKPADIPSATQWTVASDMKNLRIYYRTMYNSAIRCFDLNGINFNTVKYQVHPLDEVKAQPIIMMQVR